MKSLFPCAALAACLLLACGDDDGAAPTADAGPADARTDDGALDAAPDGHVDAADAAIDADAQPGADATTDAADAADGNAAIDAGDAATQPVDPCAAVRARVTRCQGLVGTSGIAGADVTACTETMPLLRIDPAASCFDEKARDAFDEAALGVVEAALARTPADCTEAALTTRMRWMAHFVETAKALASPAFVVDAAKLHRLDDAYWRGAYFGDPRAAAFDRTTLRDVRVDGLTCARTSLEAALAADASGQLPLTGAPLVGIAGEALDALNEAYDRTTVGHEVACHFTECTSPELADAAVTWSALAALDDAAALKAALGASAAAPAWATGIARLSSQHAALEAAIALAVGAPSYTPALLDGPSSLPGFAELFRVRRDARAKLAAFTADGTYTTGQLDSLFGYAERDSYQKVAAADLDAQWKSVEGLKEAARTARAAFEAGTAPAYDLRAHQAAERNALLWTATHITPIVHLLLPATRTLLTTDSPVAMGHLVAAVEPTSLNLWSLYGDTFGRDVYFAFTMADIRMPPQGRTTVALSFLNPRHTPSAGERASTNWLSVDSTRAKALWDGIAAGQDVTISIRPEDVYRRNGGPALLDCSRVAPVIRSQALVLEYPKGSVARTPSVSLRIPYEAAVKEPYLTASGDLSRYRTSGNVFHGDVPVGFGDDDQGINNATPLFVDHAHNGGSPFGDLKLVTSALKTAIGDVTAPASLVVFFDVDVAATASFEWVSTCKP